MSTISLLLVDDHDLARAVVRVLLKGLPVAVTEAEDGEEAVAAAEARPFAIVLMDVQMPGMGGLAAIRALRALECRRRYEPALILALTAGGGDDRAAAVAAGADGLLAKPVSRAALAAALTPRLGPIAPAAPAALAPALAILFPTFRSRLGDEIAQMRELVRTGDRTRLAKQAHRSRGQCGLFGAQSCEEMLRLLEAAAPFAPPDDLADLVERLADLHAAL